MKKYSNWMLVFLISSAMGGFWTFESVSTPHPSIVSDLNSDHFSANNHQLKPNFPFDFSNMDDANPESEKEDDSALEVRFAELKTYLEQRHRVLSHFTTTNLWMVGLYRPPDFTPIP